MTIEREKHLLEEINSISLRYFYQLRKSPVGQSEFPGISKISEENKNHRDCFITFLFLKKCPIFDKLVRSFLHAKSSRLKTLKRASFNLYSVFANQDTACCHKFLHLQLAWYEEWTRTADHFPSAKSEGSDGEELSTVQKQLCAVIGQEMSWKRLGLDEHVAGETCERWIVLCHVLMNNNMVERLWRNG